MVGSSEAWISFLWMVFVDFKQAVEKQRFLLAKSLICRDLIHLSGTPQSASLSRTTLPVY